MVGGVGECRNRLASIEKLDLNQDLEARKTRTGWLLIELATIPARLFPVFCALNKTEIAIMGGEGLISISDEDGDFIDKKYGDVHIFNTINNTCQLELDEHQSMM